VGDILYGGTWVVVAACALFLLVGVVDYILRGRK
jgi:hypothetical protein